MRAAFWKRERVHRIARGDRIALRHWYGPTELLRVASIEASWSDWEGDQIRITCRSVDHLRVAQPQKRGRLAWLRWPGRNSTERTDHQ